MGFAALKDSPDCCGRNALEGGDQSWNPVNRSKITGQEKERTECSLSGDIGYEHRQTQSCLSCWKATQQQICGNVWTTGCGRSGCDRRSSASCHAKLSGRKYRLKELKRLQVGCITWKQDVNLVLQKFNQRSCGSFKSLASGRQKRGLKYNLGGPEAKEVIETVWERDTEKRGPEAGPGI